VIDHHTYGTCKDCKHWDISDGVTKRLLDIGECKAVVMFWDATDWSQTGDARVLLDEHKDCTSFVQDGSDYTASLLTMGKFSCNRFEKTTKEKELENGPIDS